MPSPWLHTIATPPLLQKATRTPARNLRFFKRTSGAAMKSNTCTTLFCSEVTSSRGCLNNHRRDAHGDLSSANVFCIWRQMILRCLPQICEYTLAHSYTSLSISVTRMYLPTRQKGQTVYKEDILILLLKSLDL